MPLHDSIKCRQNVFSAEPYFNTLSQFPSLLSARPFVSLRQQGVAVAGETRSSVNCQDTHL